MMYPHLLNPTDITVGWEQTSYTVSEDIGSFEAFYSVIFPTSTQAIANPFFMRVATIEGTAGEIHFCMYSNNNYDDHSVLVHYILVQCTVEDDYQRIRGSSQE